MTLVIDRRQLILTGTLGLGALMLPGFVLAQGAGGFTHSVASGEPDRDSVLLWTRYVAPGDGAATIKVELSETPDFARIAGGGEAMTGPWRDGTVKITVGGLKPGTWYHYRFIAPSGEKSPVGGTKTLPDDAREWRAAVFSCSNLGFGWFNAYAHAAARRDLDCAIHLGDYFYEYAPDHYPVAADAIPGRVPLPEPRAETVHLADYRLRYASYRSDPDLQALHAALPMIAQWDDHESANDSWEGGAQNHDPATEGDWNTRRAAAAQAYREWMPVSDEPWKTYEIGQLATLFKTETRLFGRTRQRAFESLLAAPDPQAALIAFRDGAWHDPAMSMMGSQQELWLDHAIRASVRAGKRWQVVGFGTIMGKTMTPPEIEQWIGGTNPRLKSYVERAVAVSKAGLPSNLDNWGGYPAARERFLKSVQAAGGDTILISGDSHNAWAYDIAQDGAPAAVEFAGQAVTSQGYEAGLSAVDPKKVAHALVSANSELKWCDTSRRGYMALTIGADQVRNEWLFVNTVRTRNPAASVGHVATVAKGRRVMA